MASGRLTIRRTPRRQAVIDRVRQLRGGLPESRVLDEALEFYLTALETGQLPGLVVRQRPLEVQQA